ncbi:hypothetical protein BDV28DRAFT_156323 [Aspergillus coremiiformis]|uniref:Uncharacterized protein n=1 Tax=Aspergillus coremiiformis TaxID=138285 RepID=A0A5N6Z9G1_9EURO|nr:hypothetical protein BDV28DRAFT_156323 [Aspergillus coremiiformis]
MHRRKQTAFTTQVSKVQSEGDLPRTPTHYGPCGVILGRLRVRRAHMESESNKNTASMSQLKNQDRDNSDSGYHAQKHHTAQHSVILNPRTSISPEDDDPTELVSQTGGLRDKSEDDDMTASHVDQDRWSLENLPDILYVLKPEQPKSRHVIRTTAHVVFGKHINVFAVLPDQISSKVEGWRLEAWLRLDRRITVQDIIDRVNPKYRFRLTPADIELRRKTFREKFHVACWGAQKSVNDVYRRAASMGINPSLNSTRGLTPGLIDPSKGEAGGRIPLPPRAACDDHSDSGLLVQSQLLAQSSQSNPLATRLIEEPYKSHKTHSSDTIYQLHWDTKHSSKKRGPVADRFNIANPLLKRHSSHDVAR